MTIEDPYVPFNSKVSTTQIIDQALGNLRKIFRKKNIEEIAWETNFIKRISSRISGFDFLTSFLILSCGGSHCTLERMSDTLTVVSRKIKISAQALMKRINQEASVQFLKIVYSKILKEKIISIQDTPSELLTYFSKVLLQDSSSINLHEKLQKHFRGSGGRASKASAKFDIIYDWKSKDYEQITLTDRGEADQKLGLEIEDFLTEKSLVIRDLGYLRIDGLMQIIEKKAFFLSRLRSSLTVYLHQEDTHPTDIADYIVKNYKEFSQLDLQVYITAKKFPVRLVIYKVPEELVNERKRKAKAAAKKEGRQLREKTLRFMEYNLFITNVKIEIWKAEVIGTIYRIRWQIELIFKCWKSRAQIHYLKGINPERIKCLIYAKLILILLINEVYKLANYIGKNCFGRTVSMYKVFGWVQSVDRIIRLIGGGLQLGERRYFQQTVLNSMCQQKRRRKTTLERICESELYCSQSN